MSMVTTISIERTQKMNEYLYEISCDSLSQQLSDEEMMYELAYLKVHSNRKNRNKKENIESGKESDYDFYC